jgi:hypothetical protein
MGLPTMNGGCFFLFLLTLQGANGVQLRQRAGQDLRYMFSGPFNSGSPVHEIITHLALRRSGLTNNKEYDCCANSASYSQETQDAIAGASNREYLRGVIWNDDPTSTLFDDSEEDNWDFGMGAAFVLEFKSCMTIIKNVDQNTCSSLMCRSHFGDLQFIHGMANTLCEQPSVIQTRMLRWAEFTYKLAIGEISGGEQLRNVVVGSDEFNVGTELFPLHSDMTVDQLFFVPDSHHCPAPYDSTKRRSRLPWNKKGVCYYRRFNGGSVAKRAAGSLAHMIEDSYAKGHCTREDVLCDSVGADDNGETKSRARNCGAVISFNSYLGQNSDDHHDYDSRQGSASPKPTSFFRKWLSKHIKHSLKKLKALFGLKKHSSREMREMKTYFHGAQTADANSALTWIDETPGAVEAVYQVTKVFKLIKAKAPFEEAKPALQHIFRLSKDADVSGHGMGTGRHADCKGVPLPASLTTKLAETSAKEIADTEAKEIFDGEKKEQQCDSEALPPYCACNVLDWKFRHELVSTKQKLKGLGQKDPSLEFLERALSDAENGLARVWKQAPPGFKKKNRVRNDLINALRQLQEARGDKPAEDHVLARAGTAFCQPDTAAISAEHLLDAFVKTNGLRKGKRGKLNSLLGSVVDKVKVKRIQKKHSKMIVNGPDVYFR